ncbi:sensor histidine kinase [Oryzomonas japonica]|nr:HAMP domain-containing sensor histidine kinase [Oryzomonas japonica]
MGPDPVDTSSAPQNVGSDPSYINIPTHFAQAERKVGADLDEDIKQATTNGLISGLMTIANGLFAVLNDKRQVIALNDSFIKLMGIEDTAQVFGLRPGEVVNCIHACEMPGGCGTSEYCSTCGAVVSIVTAMETRQPQERTCALTVERDNQNVDLYFSVRSCPLVVDDSLYVLLFLQDISMQQYRSCLDRTFYHDVNNILCALVGKSELISLRKQPTEEKLQELHHIVLRIAQEMSIQNSLQKSLDVTYNPLYAEVKINSILKEIDQLFLDHPLKTQRNLEVNYIPSDITVITDFHLASRILINMTTNALEATPVGGKVVLGVEQHHKAVTFYVWNTGAIPEDVSRRIFQRNFSTKADMGRGFGTYSMKLFGEKVLGGSVQFESSEEKGTIFKFTLLTQ